jgi:orotate phosphoribosyltransferase
MNLEQDRQALAGILNRLSIRRGDFVLASGQRSNIYIDARVTTCHAPAMPLIGRLFLAKMAERGWRPAAVGGMSLGADPIVIAVARESVDSPAPIDAFLVRKEAKGHGMRKQIEGLPEGTGAIDVVIVDDVIVDDVCTTGDSTIKAIQAAREAGLNVLGAICLVNREQGAREAIEGGLACGFDQIFKMSEL